MNTSKHISGTHELQRKTTTNSEILDIEDSSKHGSSSCSPSQIPDEMEYVQIKLNEDDFPSMVNYIQAEDTIVEASASKEETKNFDEDDSRISFNQIVREEEM